MSCFREEGGAAPISGQRALFWGAGVQGGRSEEQGGVWLHFTGENSRTLAPGGVHQNHPGAPFLGQLRLG